MRFANPNVLMTLSIWLFACASPDRTQETTSVVTNHLKAVGGGNVNEILTDYAPDAVIYTQQGPLHGHDAIRKFFTDLPKVLPANFWDEFKMVRQDVEGEIAYIVWSGGSTPLGTDTFVIRGGKIAVQTFAAYMISPEE